MQITTNSIQEQIPYYLTQEAKENLVKALRNFPKQVNYYVDLYQDEFLQGDGWSALELIHFDNSERKTVKGILLSNSCDINHENKRDFPSKITFAPIIKLRRYVSDFEKAGIDKQKIQAKTEAIREQKVTTLFYLPQGGNLDDDYIADFTDIHTIPFTSFQSREDKHKLFTLSQVGFYLFLFKLSIHFCRFHEDISR